jgi:hypothetical protein
MGVVGADDDQRVDARMGEEGGEIGQDLGPSGELRGLGREVGDGVEDGHHLCVRQQPEIADVFLSHHPAACDPIADALCHAYPLPIRDT